MLVATDITAQVKAEHEQQRLSEQLLHAQKMEAIGQLTGALAHDFNNLLLAVRGNLELSELPDTTEQERAVCVETALEALTRAGTLTARLLAFSRKQVLQPKSLDVGAFVKDMQKLLVGALGETVSVRVNAPLLMSYCQVDPVQLESAVLNLAINARDAMPDGGELQIGCAEFRSMGRGSDPVPAGNYVLVQVSDTGSGMSADTIAHAFEPFFTTKDVGHGTGLGLSMVHGFVNQSGGHVRILSDPPHGTMVEIYLPVSEEGRTPRIGRRAGDGPVRGDRQLILLVEDNEMVRTLTARMLKRLGYRVVVAEDADAALKRFEEDQDIALLLTDVVLPGGQDGCQLAQLCRKKRPKLPVVLVSGYPRDALPLGGSEAWSPLLLRKPYTTGQMADHLSQAFDPGTVAIRRAAE